MCKHRFCLRVRYTFRVVYFSGKIIIPKDQQSQIGRLRGNVLEYGDGVFCANGRVLFCKVCELYVEYERRSSVLQHVKTEKHARMVNDGK